MKKTISRALVFTILWVAVTLSLAGAASQKLFYINSYHKGYQWSDDIEKGLLKALCADPQADGTEIVSRNGMRIRILRMDTKRNPDETFKQKAALNAKAIIDQWQPDVVVVSDDNAAKYLLVPYFKETSIPFVFCGLNWDASIYGLPAANTTGMIEVAPLPETLEMLKHYARGERLGFIGFDGLSNRKTIPLHKQILGIDYVDGRLVSTFEQWRREYLRLQTSVDILIWLNPIGIKGWNAQQAMDFILENTKIPTGCSADHIIRYVLMSRTNVAEEQGWWAGNTALKILAGTLPADIPVVRNKESRLFLNMKLANRMGIRFPMELIQKATLVQELDRQKQP